MPLFAQSGGGDGMAQNGIVVNPRTGDVWGRPARFAPVLETFPRLHVVLAHALAGYNGTMGDVLALADRYERVYFDTTVVTPRAMEQPALVEDLVRLIRRVGAEHCVFGSNFPLTEFDHDRRRYIAFIEALPLLTDREKRQILSDNGLRILRGSERIGVDPSSP
jgi:predicted TIM-barrel fold metal-dependent hydrolase